MVHRSLRTQAFTDSGLYPNSHAGRCVNANLQILSLYGDRLQYNSCRNLEWLVCAALGQLPGQLRGPRLVAANGNGSAAAAQDDRPRRGAIVFAYEPSRLQVYGRRTPLGRCGGWRSGDDDDECVDG